MALISGSYVSLWPIIFVGCHGMFIGLPLLSGKSESGNSRASSFPDVDSKLYQGDILLPEDQDARNGLNFKPLLWPSGQVYYKIDSAFTDEERGSILKAMRFLESKTCVKFLEPTLGVKYVEIRRENKGCFAMVGFQPLRLGATPMNLQSPGCLKNNGVIQHELLHVLGLFHEQSRPDRDDFVEILWDNIEKEYHPQFDKVDSIAVSTFDVPYNYMSVMHYPRTAFSKNGNATIIAKTDPNKELGQRVEAAEGDLKKINEMYDCN